MDRRRFWVPFLIGMGGAAASLMLSQPIGHAIGTYNDLSGWYWVVFYAAVPIVLVAALVTRTWSGALNLWLGFGATGALAGAYAALQSDGNLLPNMLGGAVLVAVAMGPFGLPTYALIMGIVRVVARRKRWAGGWD